MTFQTFRPSGLPYEAPEMWPYLEGILGPLKANHVQLPLQTLGSGSLSDDSDTTAVHGFGSQHPDSDTDRNTIWAVDFAPVPGLADTTTFGSAMRVEVPSVTLYGAAYLTDWFIVDSVASHTYLQTFFGRWDDDVDTYSQEAGIQDLATPGTYYEFTAGAQDIIRSSGFTVVFYTEGMPGYEDSPGVASDKELFTLYEFGLVLDVASTVGQLYVNLSHDEGVPNWVSVCDEVAGLGHWNISTDPGAPNWQQIHLGGGTTGGTSELPPGSTDDATDTSLPDWVQTIRDPSPNGSVLDSDDATYARLWAVYDAMSFSQLNASVLTVNFPPISTGTPVAFHMKARLRNSQDWLGERGEINTLYAKVGTSEIIDWWRETNESVYQLGPLIGGDLLTFADYRFYFLGITGNPDPTVPDSYWRSVAPGVGGVPQQLYEALTTTGLKIHIFMNPALASYSDRHYLDVAKIELVVATEGSSRTYVNLSATPGTPEWWDCCSHF